MFHSIMNPLRNRLSALRKGEEGTLSVEAVLILPMLLWAFLATFTFFDVYRAKSLSLKANYAISDLLSRESIPVDMAYLDGLKSIYAYLAKDGDQAWVRVSVIWCKEDCEDQSNRELKLDWSEATGSVVNLSEAEIQASFNDVIPVIASGEHLIMVETMSKYSPPFSTSLTGIGERDLYDLVTTRPRFAGQLCWESPTCSSN